MRHLVAHRKLGRTTAHRKSLLRNLCTSLILEERIETTLPKGPVILPDADPGGSGAGAQNRPQSVRFRSYARPVIRFKRSVTEWSFGSPTIAISAPTSSATARSGTFSFV